MERGRAVIGMASRVFHAVQCRFSRLGVLLDLFYHQCPALFGVGKCLLDKNALQSKEPCPFQLLGFSPGGVMDLTDSWDTLPMFKTNSDR